MADPPKEDITVTIPVLAPAKLVNIQRNTRAGMNQLLTRIAGRRWYWRSCSTVDKHRDGTKVG